MGEEDGLRTLKMSVPGHHCTLIRLREIQQRRLHAPYPQDGVITCFHHEQAHISGDLVVTRAGRMQPSRALADLLLKARLDIEVDVL